MLDSNIHFSDVLVIGSGLAGQSSALAASKYSNHVTILSKVSVMRSHSVAAGGGINSVSGYEDSIDDHFVDTVQGSDYLADQNAVKILVKNAPFEISFLEELGVKFDKIGDKILPNKFGGAKFARTLNSSFKTGLSIMDSLFDSIKNSNISLFEGFHVIDLLVQNNTCFGIMALNMKNSQLTPFFSKTTILATGPYGYLFNNTTNSVICTGDGLAIAYRAGASLKDMEFVQFHPTSLIGSNILITERARAKGAYLLNNKGERFLKKYAPKSMELAPRDIISRAIIKEIELGLAFEDAEYGFYMELSFTHLPEDIILQSLKDIRDIGLHFTKTDIITEPLKVIPAQHYMMGGIDVDLNCNTDVNGLYAAGECACLSVHGANRLGGNSLMECLVFGRISGKSASIYSQSISNFDYDIANQLVLKQDSKFKKTINSILNSSENLNISHILKEMKIIMTSHASISRNKKSLQHAKEQLSKLQILMNDIRINNSDTYSNIELCSYFELHNMLDLSEIIIESSLERKESRGSHFRLDYPIRNDKEWLNHILIKKTDSGFNLSTKSVDLSDLSLKTRNY